MPTEMEVVFVNPNSWQGSSFQEQNRLYLNPRKSEGVGGALQSIGRLHQSNKKLNEQELSFRLMYENIRYLRGKMLGWKYFWMQLQQILCFPALDLALEEFSLLNTEGYNRVGGWKLWAG